MLLIAWATTRLFSLAIGQPTPLVLWDASFIVLVLIGFGLRGLYGPTLRPHLLDEIRKPYVTTARAKGLRERRLTLKYPVRVALIPFASTVGWTLPALVSGASIVSIVLGLQTLGPLALRAWLAQDVYLGGALLLLESTLTVIGTFLSDILLAWLDPRIRLV